MAKLADMTMDGKSGKEYEFGVYPYQESWKEVAAVYIVSSRTEKSDGTGTHDLLYVGETENLNERFGDHHKKSCFKNNDADCISVLQVSGEKERSKIESDILKNYSFNCNE